MTFIIKPRARGKYVHKVIAHFDDQNYETLQAYAQFIDESTDYVLNELVDGGLTRNKAYLAWLAEHPHAHAPRLRSSPARGASRRARTPGTPDSRVSDATTR